MLLLSNRDLSEVLTPQICMEAVERVILEVARREAVSLGRFDLYTPSGVSNAPYHRWSVMAGGSKHERVVGARMFSDMVGWSESFGFRRETKYARRPGLFCGFIMLFDAETAEPVAILNDGVLQHMRVAAAAGLGAKVLSKKDSRVLGMIGSSWMAQTFVDAIAAVRPIERVKVFSPNPEHVRRYAEDVRRRHKIEVEIASSGREAVRGADIAALCTSSVTAVFQADWLEPGMHVTDVGSHQAEPALLQKVNLAVLRGQAAIPPPLDGLPQGAGHVHHALLGFVAGSEKERALLPPRLLETPEFRELPTLADVMDGRSAGRRDARQTTWFISQGDTGATFAAVAAAAYREASRRGVGTQLPTEWLLQDITD